MSKYNSNKATNAMYTQQMAYLPAKTIDNLIDVIERVVKPAKYAVILHDSDTDDNGQPKPAHTHVMLSFKNARSVNAIAKALKDKPQYIEKWKGNAGNGYSYLIHATKEAKDKYQYSPNDVHANFDYIAELQSITKEVETVQKFSVTKVLLDALYVGGITKEELETRLSGSQYGQNRRKIEDIHAKRLQNLARLWREEKAKKNAQIETIWIFGTAGTGKTSLAKEYAQKKGQPFFISGSSRDSFQQYNSQHTIIFDDFRPESIQYQDLLRILDPFSITDGVMAPSRYHDKALACDLFIVTSPYNPYAFYNACVRNENERIIDRFEQLLRRITLTMYMTQTEIYIAEYDDNSRRFEPLPSSVKLLSGV